VNGELLLTASAVTAAPSVSIGLLVALIDPDSRPLRVAVVAFVVLTALMMWVLG
jgi:hypothetical protein